MKGGKRKGAGRPKGSKGKGSPRIKMVNIRLTSQECEDLTSQANRQGITLSKLIRHKLIHVHCGASKDFD